MPARTASSIKVRSVTKRFATVAALDGVDLDVDPGRIVALLGPSGCGKTTLLRAIAGLEHIDAGEIEVGGRPVSGADDHVAPERRGIGMVFQDWALFPHLSVARNVGYGVAGEDDRRARVDRALALVGLSGMGARSPDTLSGGQQQRVALARALAPEPSALLLDEPFSNLDTSLRAEVRADVHRLLADLGITSVFVTHDQEEAFVLGAEVAVMRAGQVVQQAPPAEVYAAPADPGVARFIGDANLLPGTGSGREAMTAFGTVPLSESRRGPVEVLVRPEELAITARDDASNGAARVELVEFYGHDTVYWVELDDGTSVQVRAGSGPRFSRGDQVALRYRGGETIAYDRGRTA